MVLVDAFRRGFSFLSLRRGYPRTRTAVGVDWRVFGSGVHGVTTTNDLSPAGAFIRTGEPRPVNTPLVLELSTHGGPVEVHARVAWTGPGGMGVRFTRTIPA